MPTLYPRRFPFLSDPLSRRFSTKGILLLSSSNAYTIDQIMALGPTLFLDERDLVVVTGDYNNWGNQAVAGADNNDFVAPNTPSRPLTGSLINGYAAPYFQAAGLASNKRLTQVSGAFPTILSTTNYSIFAVVSCSMLSGTAGGTGASEPVIWGDAGQRIGVGCNAIVSSSGIRFFNQDDTGRDVTGTIPIATGSFLVVEGHFTSGSYPQLRVNNYLTSSGRIVSTISGTAQALGIGASTTSVHNGFNGGIASVIAFNRNLSAVEQRGVREYLANKYRANLTDQGANVPLTPAQKFGQALTVWCRASEGIIGNPISIWTSSGSISCFMSAAGSTPRPDQSIQNGLITPLFNGVNDVLGSYSDISGTTFLPFASASGTGQWEILIAGIANGLSASAETPNLETTIFACQTNNSHGVTVNSDGTRTFTTTTNGQVITPFASGTLAPYERFLIHSYYDGANLVTRLNNNTPVSAACSGSITSAENEMLLGRDSSVGPDFTYNGNIFEFMVFSRSLNTTERNWARTYFGNKWGLYV